MGLVVAETAGLRRFGYPVHTVVPGFAPGLSFRLLKEGRVVPAQFRPIVGADGRPAIALDFTSNLGPLESERYVVDAAAGGEPGPEPKGGLRLAEAESSVRVRSGASLAYAIGAGLQGFLESVTNGGRDYIELSSGGLSLRCRASNGDRVVRFGGDDGRALRGSITRQGPLAIGLRYEGTTAVPGAEPVSARVDLTFPSSKSWVEATWRVDDPLGLVTALQVDLRLKLEEGPALVDLGTAATIYGVLRGRERMTLTAGTAPGLAASLRPWVVQKGPLDRMTTFAEAPRADAAAAEGWAHVMDVSRCTALAVAGFGRGSRDRIEIASDGLVRIAREFAGGPSAPPRGPKTLTFWLHFVPMPVHVGVATSPQAMLAPLAIAWDKPGLRSAAVPFSPSEAVPQYHQFCEHSFRKVVEFLGRKPLRFTKIKEQGLRMRCGVGRPCRSFGPRLS